jgi:hypothetical protein
MFMKRLFFALLFALTALSFTACSSSDDDSSGGGGSSPVDIKGYVIVPNAYSSGFVYVCSDADKSNTCSIDETYVKAGSDGAFAITARADLPLLAEFYDTDPVKTTGVSVLSLNSAEPKLIYTSPAGKTTISAFTTMVKNKIDLAPTEYTVEKASMEVQYASGIKDPFNTDSYSDSNVAKVHEVVSKVVEGLLDYLTSSAGLNIEPGKLSSAHVAALYNLVFDMVESIALDPENADPDLLVGSAENSVEDAVNEAASTLGAVDAAEYFKDKNLTVYQLVTNSNRTEYRIEAIKFEGLTISFGEKKFAEVKSALSNTGDLPAFSFEDALPLSHPDVNVVRVSVEDAEGAISANNDFNLAAVNFSGAKKFTLFTGSSTPTPDTIAFLKERKDYHSTDNGGSIYSCANNSNGQLTDGCSRDFGTIKYFNDMTFRWTPSGEKSTHPFSPIRSSHSKIGTYTKNSYDHPNLGAEYTFSATDGTVIYYYYGYYEVEGSSPYSNWTVAFYETEPEGKIVLFDEAGIKNIISQWNSSVIP